ncbi:hypothetical protein PHLCEN_2v7797 [Hermanssonia centrifuga]|uniref:Uncharacterized protein n=1 Tax=Hermanssonia centrifuga TaxID=98765 RepID=A0A2R6NVJ8_9APHY|nr:hypothetical protein PHLCEN_2v7797 [Hermanssonia centrifuga]
MQTETHEYDIAELKGTFREAFAHISTMCETFEDMNFDGKIMSEVGLTEQLLMFLREKIPDRSFDMNSQWELLETWAKTLQAELGDKVEHHELAAYIIYSSKKVYVVPIERVRKRWEDVNVQNVAGWNRAAFQALCENTNECVDENALF